MRPTLEHVEEAAKHDKRINGKNHEETAESEVDDSGAMTANEGEAPSAQPTKAVSITRRFEKRSEGAINSNRESEQRTKREEQRLADEEPWLPLAPQAIDVRSEIALLMKRWLTQCPIVTRYGRAI